MAKMFDLWIVFVADGAAELVTSGHDYEDLSQAARQAMEDDPSIAFIIWPAGLPMPTSISCAAAASS